MPSSCDIQTQGKIINLVKSILNHYQILETLNPIKYYAHNEIGSILTEFEGLSNSRKIILATSIESKFVPVVMKIFQCVYDSNYWIFENIEISIRVDQVDNNELLDLLTYSNINLWIKYLEMTCCGEFNIFENSIANEQIYTSIPPIEPKYYCSTKRQKIYTIADIINLVKKDT
jgi:hypothetical protein